MDTAKAKKLEEYSIVLERQARQFESESQGNEAAKIYVKLVDILLLLAREAPDHPTWLKYSSRAEAFQKRAKACIAGENAAAENSGSSGKTQTIKRFFGMKSSEQQEQKPVQPYPIPSQQGLSPQNPTDVYPPKPKTDSAQTEAEQIVPKKMYDQVVEKNKKLELQVSSMVERSELEKLQAQCRELNSKLADSIPLAEYNDLRQRVEGSVPLSQFEELRRTISTGYVPRSQYEDLQNLVVSLVPKDQYAAAQARITELESQLAFSIPRTVLDNLASEISLLAVIASIPLGTKSENENGSMHDEIMNMKQRLAVMEQQIAESRVEHA